MTVTEIEQKRDATWRAFFHDLAYDVASGGTTVLVGHLVARRIADGCPDPAATFDRLVEAVKDLTAYTASREAEGDWLVAHNLKTDEESRHCYLAVILEQIDSALDALLPGVSA